MKARLRDGAILVATFVFYAWLIYNAPAGCWNSNGNAVGMENRNDG